MSHILTVFRSRLRPEHEKEYYQEAESIFALAQAMPGFLGLKTFIARDGERVSIVEFASQETHDAWRSHPEHQVAQRLGREKYYAEFRLQVCRIDRDYGMGAPKPAQPGPARS